MRSRPNLHFCQFGKECERKGREGGRKGGRKGRKGGREGGRKGGRKGGRSFVNKGEKDKI
jgi:hypothetical protein